MVFAFNPRVTETIPQLYYQPVIAAVLKQCVRAVTQKQVLDIFLVCKPQNRLELLFIFNLNQSRSLAAGPERSVFTHICVFYYMKLMVCDKRLRSILFSVIEILRHVIFYSLQKLRQPLC